jgi:hypothetical protein
MTFHVIAPFIDKRTGERVEAGGTLPEGLDRATVQRLVRARCLEPADAGGVTPARPADAGPSTSLFPEDGAGDLVDTAEGGEPEPAPRQRGRKGQAAP